jgi:hypothetical protein
MTAVISNGRVSESQPCLQGPAEEATAGGNAADAADAAAAEAFPDGMLTAFIDAAKPSQGSASQVPLCALTCCCHCCSEVEVAHACQETVCTQASCIRTILMWRHCSAGPRTATCSVPRCCGEARVPGLRRHPGRHAGGGRRSAAARSRRGPAGRRRRWALHGLGFYTKSDISVNPHESASRLRSMHVQVTHMMMRCRI